MYLTGRYIIRHQLRVADTLSDTTPEEPHWPIHYQTPAASRRYIIRHDPRGRTPLHVLRSYPLLDLSTRSILQDLDARVSFLKADTLSDTPGAPFSVYALVCSVWPLSRSRHAFLIFQVFTLTSPQGKFVCNPTRTNVFVSALVQPVDDFHFLSFNQIWGR